ncbi:hypothetical protein TrST_g109 [Triparma strigata]|uniref:Uncharacterized protein n=1 Tax=Triparma strigata TaxID=1606541 RepID=A0A9W7A6Y2_9STRA|nr:hypothetical protein TrST_g109 [Triparma strigata]
MVTCDNQPRYVIPPEWLKTIPEYGQNYLKALRTLEYELIDEIVWSAISRGTFEQEFDSYATRPWCVSPVWAPCDSDGHIRELFIYMPSPKSCVGDLDLIGRSFPELTLFYLAQADLSGYSDGWAQTLFMNMTKLEYVEISKSKATGPFPNFSKNKNLKILRLDENDFSGELPSTFNGKNLPNLEALQIDMNQFRGGVEALKTFPKLQKIKLDYNFFDKSSITNTTLCTSPNTTAYVGRVHSNSEWFCKYARGNEGDELTPGFPPYEKSTNGEPSCLIQMGAVAGEECTPYDCKGERFGYKRQCTSCAASGRCNIDFKTHRLMSCVYPWEGPVCGDCPEGSFESAGHCILCASVGAMGALDMARVFAGVAFLILVALFVWRKLKILKYKWRLSVRTNILSKQVLASLQVILMASFFRVSFPWWYEETKFVAKTLTNAVPAPPTPCLGGFFDHRPPWFHGLLAILLSVSVIALLLLTSLFVKKTKAKRVLQQVSAIIFLQSCMVCARVLINVPAELSKLLDLLGVWGAEEEALVIIKDLVFSILCVVQLAISGDWVLRTVGRRYKLAMCEFYGDDLTEEEWKKKWNFLSFYSAICGSYVPASLDFERAILTRKWFVFISGQIIYTAQFSVVIFKSTKVLR